MNRFVKWCIPLLLAIVCTLTTNQKTESGKPADGVQSQVNEQIARFVPELEDGVKTDSSNAVSTREDEAKKREITNYALNQKGLHVWSPNNAAWMPMDQVLDELKKKAVRVKSTMISRKFAGLNPAEIRMYNAVESGCSEFYGLSLPHDLLMVILVYSQGHKFEVGDHCLFFPSGIFGDSARGEIKQVLEDSATNKYSYQYLVTYSRRGGPSHRVPPNHVFAPRIVIVDADLFAASYPQHNGLKYGNVLKITKLTAEEVNVFSKKKKRNIRKMKLFLHCHDPTKLKTTQRGQLRVQWDNNLFVQAKMKNVAI